MRAQAAGYTQAHGIPPLCSGLGSGDSAAASPAVRRVAARVFDAGDRTGAVDGGDRHAVSTFGLDIVERMNAVGMAVDVSHCGDRTTLDAFEASKKPVLITHSNCRALSGHPRCKTDEAMRRMAQTGGVMGITGVRMFVKASEPTTVEDVLDHFDYAARVAG
ncbi:MAG: membrane dipeptidase [Bryobacterales bacterium]|nr:membrane dipeptidase [Bryobacterales bacterium]